MQPRLRPRDGGERSIGYVRATPVALLGPVLVALLCAAPAPAAPVHVLDPEGRVHVRQDPFLPPPDPAGTRPEVRKAAGPEVATARAASSRRTVPGELRRLLDAGAIDRATHDRHRATWDAARRTLRRLDGRREVELRAVLRNVEQVAAGGGLTSGRLPAAFETVARNRQWWSNGALLGYGQRVAFTGSRLVWQSYPGQGIQIQWLGTFGKANGLFLSGRHDDELAALLDEAVALAAPRAGGLAWESWFRFDGGRPPWVSALSQGTAIQALSRGAVRLAAPGHFETARAGLGIFRARPPAGVRVSTEAGAHYLIYSFAPRLRVLNGFVQSLIGLRDFGALANDEDGRALFAAGEAQLRTEVPRYDTGAWSMYSQARESDLGYHKLLRDFLRNLCGRLEDDRERAARQAQAPSPVPGTGGVAPQPGAAPPAPDVPDPALYCETATRFSSYLGVAPQVELGSPSPRRPRARRGVTVTYTLSKISTVTTRVSRGGRVVAGRTARLGRGRHVLRFTPREAGAHAVTVRAVDLAGNAATARAAVAVARARR